MTNFQPQTSSVSYTQCHILRGKIKIFCRENICFFPFFCEVLLASENQAFTTEASCLWTIISTHYQTTNFRLFQTERVCRRQFQIWRKWQKDIQTGRKHRGKRRYCSLRAISTFSTLFSKGLFPRGVKRCHSVGMG